jgi:hypothetical protein
MSKQKPKSAKKAALSRRSNRTLKGKRKSIAPVARTAAAEGKATETTEAHARASGFLPVIPTHAISAESLDGIPYLTEEDIAAASGELSPQERQAIEEILRQPNPVELPETAAPRKKGKAGPAYDIVNEGDEKIVDYGPFLLKQEANGEVSFCRSDGTAVLQGIPIVGRDSAEVATIREALRVYRDPNESAAWRATSLELLRVWSFLEKAERSWSETSYYRYSDAYVMRPCSEMLPLSGALTDGSKALFPIELATCS